MDFTINTFSVLIPFNSFPLLNVEVRDYCFSADFNQVIFLGFDRSANNRVFDNAPHHNNATLVNGALIRKTDGSCGNCVELLGGNVQFNGVTFQGNDASTILNILTFLGIII